MTSWPGDAQDWSDEEWLDWLAATDPAVAPSTPRDADEEPPSWRRAGIGTQIVAAAMTGLAEAIYGPKEKPAIVVDASGDPPGDGALELTLDPDRPEHSVVVIRPWLLRDTGER